MHFDVNVTGYSSSINWTYMHRMIVLDFIPWTLCCASFEQRTFDFLKRILRRSDSVYKLHSTNRGLTCALLVAETNCLVTKTLQSSLQLSCHGYARQIMEYMYMCRSELTFHNGLCMHDARNPKNEQTLHRILKKDRQYASRRRERTSTQGHRLLTLL